MAIKYYLNESGLETLLNAINVQEPNNEEISDNLVVIVKANKISSSKEVSTITLNTSISQEIDDNGVLHFIFNDFINETIKTFSYFGSVANLSSVSEPATDKVYKNEKDGLYAIWNGQGWDKFGIIDNFTSELIKSDIQAVSNSVLNKVLYSYKPFVVTTVAELIEAINTDQEVIVINIDNDLNLSSTIQIPSKKEITINLNKHSINANTMAFRINNSEVSIQNGSITSSNNDTIVVDNTGRVIIDNVDIVSSKRQGITLQNNSVGIINSGSITAQEAGIVVFKNSTVVVNDGIITSIDNGPIMGNGSAAGSANDGTNATIIMNGGKLIGHIQSAGYIACGVYVPNSGSFTMNGGEIESDGAGVVMRGGRVNLNGGKITATGETGVVGKVGDSRIVVGPYAVVYDVNSKYPAMDSLELNIKKGMVLVGTDGDLSFVGIDQANANVTDNRVINN